MDGLSVAALSAVSGPEPRTAGGSPAGPAAGWSVAGVTDAVDAAAAGGWPGADRRGSDCAGTDCAGTDRGEGGGSAKGADGEAAAAGTSAEPASSGDPSAGPEPREAEGDRAAAGPYPRGCRACRAARPGGR